MIFSIGLGRITVLWAESRAHSLPAGNGNTDPGQMINCYGINSKGKEILFDHL